MIYRTRISIDLGVVSAITVANQIPAWESSLCKSYYFWPSQTSRLTRRGYQPQLISLNIDGFDQRGLDWLIQVDIKRMETDVLMTVTYDYTAKAKKPSRHASVAVTLPRIAENIGYGEPKVLPTFYNDHMSDTDFRLKHDIA